MVTNANEQRMKKVRAWAELAIVCHPGASDVAGLSYEEASCKATAICEAGARTGRTINAAYWLAALASVMEAHMATWPRSQHEELLPGESYRKRNGVSSAKARRTFRGDGEPN